MHSMRSKIPDKGKDMILLKIHDEGVVSLCDSDIIGKTFEEGDLQLHVLERFYKGEEATREEIVTALVDSKISNIVGKESVQLAIDEGLITKQSIKTVDGVPHVQIFSM